MNCKYESIFNLEAIWGAMQVITMLGNPIHQCLPAYDTPVRTSPVSHPSMDAINYSMHMPCAIIVAVLFVWDFCFQTIHLRQAELRMNKCY